jgi:hypothetical protein
MNVTGHRTAASGRAGRSRERGAHELRQKIMGEHAARGYERRLGRG